MKVISYLTAIGMYDRHLRFLSFLFTELVSCVLPSNSIPKVSMKSRHLTANFVDIDNRLC
jgi:hypothetical protein